jgi:hypothetical protein
VLTGSTLKALNPVIATDQRLAGLESNPGFYNNFVTWQVGFTFQMPLGMRSPLANTRNAQYTLLRARAFLQQVVHQTTHSLARFFLEIDANYKQFKTASRLRAAAAQRLDAQRAYYEEGRITIDRFLDAVSQYATAVATEAQHKTTYNISIVALEEAKGTLLAYDNIAVAEGPQPRKAYVQARDIQDAHKQHHIAPDGPMVPQQPVGPLNPDPSVSNPPPGVEDPKLQPEPGPSGPLGPRPSSVAPHTPATILPELSQTAPAPGGSPTAAGSAMVGGGGVSLTSGPGAGRGSTVSASLIEPTVPGVGSTSVAESLGRSKPAAPPAALPDVQAQRPAPASGSTPKAAPAGSSSAATTPSAAPPAKRSSSDELPPLPVSIDLPPLPPG